MSQLKAPLSLAVYELRRSATFAAVGSAIARLHDARLPISSIVHESIALIGEGIFPRALSEAEVLNELLHGLGEQPQRKSSLVGASHPEAVEKLSKAIRAMHDEEIKAREPTLAPYSCFRPAVHLASYLKARFEPDDDPGRVIGSAIGAVFKSDENHAFTVERSIGAAPRLDLSVRRGIAKIVAAACDKSRVEPNGASRLLCFGKPGSGFNQAVKRLSGIALACYFSLTFPRSCTEPRRRNCYTRAMRSLATLAEHAADAGYKEDSDGLRRYAADFFAVLDVLWRSETWLNAWEEHIDPAQLTSAIRSARRANGGVCPIEPARAWFMVLDLRVPDVAVTKASPRSLESSGDSAMGVCLLSDAVGDWSNWSSDVSSSNETFDAFRNGLLAAGFPNAASASIGFHWLLRAAWGPGFLDDSEQWHDRLRSGAPYAPAVTKLLQDGFEMAASRGGMLAAQSTDMRAALMRAAPEFAATKRASVSVLKLVPSPSTPSRKLRELLGEECWDGLDSELRRDLEEAEQTYMEKAHKLGAKKLDWGTVLLPYCKAIEMWIKKQLQPILADVSVAGILHEKGSKMRGPAGRANYTFGRLVEILHRAGSSEASWALLDEHVPWFRRWPEAIDVLREIVRIRNGAAHAGSCSPSDVMRLRELLFNERSSMLRAISIGGGPRHS